MKCCAMHLYFEIKMIFLNIISVAHCCTALNVNAMFSHTWLFISKMTYKIDWWMVNVQFLICKDNWTFISITNFQISNWHGDGDKQLPMGLTLMRKAFCKWDTVWNSIKCENKPVGWQLNEGLGSGKHTKC